MNSSIRLRPWSSYPPSLFPSVNHGTLILLLLAGDVELNPGPSPLNFTHLNIRSIRSFQKSSSLHNYLADHPTEILSLNETWLQPTDSDNFVSSLAPPGYSILHSPRLTGQGGGLAIIFRSYLKFKLFRTRNLPPPESFELMATKLSTGNKETIFLNIYRPPSSKISTFLQEFQNLLEIFVSSPSELIISGDFNIHADSDLTTSHNFSGILDNFHLTQHINFPTHDDGHTPWSSHHSIQLYCYHTPFTIRILPVWSQIFHFQILPTHPSYNRTNNHPIQLLQYHRCWQLQKWHSRFPLSTQSQLPMHPTLQINFPPPSDPFLTSMPQLKPKQLSKDPILHGLTPKFSKPSGNAVDLNDVGVAGSPPLTAKKFRAQCNSVRSLVSKAKSSFLSNLVTESSTNPRTLWKTLNTILHRNPSNSLPESPDASSLANTFLDFFKDKIDRIRTKFLPSHSPDPFLFPPAPPSKMINFIPATFTEIYKLISASESKQCPLDSIPTFLLKLLQWTPSNHHKSCQSLSFWRNFSIVIQTSFCPASSQKNIFIHWWSQQLSSNFKPHLHFQNSRKSCCFPHSISLDF